MITIAESFHFIHFTLAANQVLFILEIFFNNELKNNNNNKTYLVVAEASWKRNPPEWFHFSGE